METISGGPSEQFLPDTILQAAKLNKALENWVVTEVPGEDEGEIGDVVFVTGPGDGGSSSSVGGGKVLQVVSTKAPGILEITTNTPTSLGFPCSITVQENSKLLVSGMTGLYAPSNSQAWSNVGRTYVFIDGSQVMMSEHDGTNTQEEQAHTVTVQYLSDPLSAGTYQVDLRATTVGNTPGPISYNRQGIGSLIVMEVGE